MASASTSNAVVAGRSSDYTSLSALGASLPLTPSQSHLDESREASGWSAHRRTMDRILIRKPRRYLASYARLLLPGAATLDDADDEDDEDEVAGAEDALPAALPPLTATETTPLLHAQLPSSSNRSSGKYIGGGCVCDPFERFGTGIKSQTNDAIQLNRDATNGASSSCSLCPGPDASAYGDQSFGRVNNDAGVSKPSGMSIASWSHICYALMSLSMAKLSVSLWQGSTHVQAQKRAIGSFQFIMWQHLALILITFAILIVHGVGLRTLVLGPVTARAWHWSRAICSTLSGLLFVLAAQGIPICELVVIVYLAPVVYNIASRVFFTSRHPVRAQLVSLSLWLGLVLLVQPEVLQGQQRLLFSLPNDERFDDFTLPASPVDALPLMLITADRVFHIRWYYAAAIGSAIFGFLSIALLDHSPTVVRSGHHSLFLTSILTLLAAVALNGHLFNTHSDKHGKRAGPFEDIPLLFASWTNALLTISIVTFSFVARIFQDASILGRRGGRKIGACQLGVISFAQPLLSTGVGVLLDEDFVIGDILPLAGCLLIIVNLAWIAAPSDDDEEDQHHPSRPLSFSA